MPDRQLPLEEFSTRLHSILINPVFSPSIISQERMIEVARDLGWYDWYCGNSQIYRKVRNSALIARDIIRTGFFTPNAYFIFFENVIPVPAARSADRVEYDLIKFCDKRSQLVRYAIKIGDRREGPCALYGWVNAFNTPLATGPSERVISFFQRREWRTRSAEERREAQRQRQLQSQAVNQERPQFPGQGSTF